MVTQEFLREFKRATEEKWDEKSIDPTLYGFQFQRGTRWNAGLSEDLIAEYEGLLGLKFPIDFKAFLREMNGTDLPTVNVYGSCGERNQLSTGVYSYPRDIELAKIRIQQIAEIRSAFIADLAAQGFCLPADAQFAPFYVHRFIVCSSDRRSSVVLSIQPSGPDAIVYGNSLQDYLLREFLDDH
jgi:hypothetical protein